MNQLYLICFTQRTPLTFQHCSKFVIRLLEFTRSTFHEQEHECQNVSARLPTRNTSSSIKGVDKNGWEGYANHNSALNHLEGAYCTLTTTPSPPPVPC